MMDGHNGWETLGVDVVLEDSILNAFAYDHLSLGAAVNRPKSIENLT
jgi:hypothetical protein